MKLLLSGQRHVLRADVAARALRVDRLHEDRVRADRRIAAERHQHGPAMHLRAACVFRIGLAHIGTGFGERGACDEVVVEKEENVFPMVPAGASVAQIRLK